MTIAAVCPHCESRYNLQPDLLGKAMRCPNPDCREVFVVAEAKAAPAPPPVAAPEPPPVPKPAAPRVDAPPPAYRSGTVGELVPVLEAAPTDDRPYERVEADPLPALPLVEGEPVRPPKPPRPKLPVAPLVFDAETAPPRRPKPPAPPAPKEVEWSEEVGPKEVDWAAAPPPAVAAPDRPPPVVARSPDAEVEDLLLRRRGRGRNYWAVALVGLVVAIFAVGIGIGVRLILFNVTVEERLVAEAADEFKKQNYPKAAELHNRLLAEFPNSTDTDRYRFFADLSAANVIAGSVTVRDDPAEGLAKYRAFLADHGANPLAKPDDTGYGHDVFEAGSKLVEGTVGHAQDRLANFRSDRTKLAQLDAAEKTVEDARQLIPTVEKYRLKDVKPLDGPRQKLDELAAACGRERLRLAVLAPYRDLPADPAEPRIAEFVTALTRNGFEKDAEATAIVEAAKAKLRGLIRYVSDVRPWQTPPPDASPGLLFVAPPAGRQPAPTVPPPPDAVPETFFALARGVLYAFDADTGNLLWAVRVGPAATDLPARLPAGTGGGEVALVPTDVAGIPGLTARDVRTGRPEWYQPLEAPPAGRPVVVGRRVYVPLKDDAGTVVEFAPDGRRLGFIQLRQRIGPGAVRHPGTGLVYVAAEARRVFALDVEPHDAEGSRLPVRCVQVLATGHPELSLRVPPVPAGPAGGPAGSQYLVLVQNDGAQATLVRAFPLPPASAPQGDAGPPEVAPPPAPPQSVPGHVWFPPAADGERIALVTDAGALALFGTNLPGNHDPGLYPVPLAQPLPADPQHPIAGQVAAAGEDTFWVLARGKLLRLRLGLTPQSGLAVSPAGLPLPGGVPVQSGQANAARDTVFAAVRSEDADGVRAVAFDPRDGRVKWERKLGAVPAAPPVPVGAAATLVVDEDGGAYLLPPAAASAAADGAKPIDRSWIAAPPLPAATAPAKVAATPDGGTVWVLVPERGEKDAAVLRVRQFEAGKLKAEATVALPEKLAGPAVAVGGGVAVPLANGFAYRFDPKEGKLVQGPQWREAEAAGDAGCFLSPAGEDEFLATDGAAVRRWRWGPDGEWKPVAGPWKVREKIAFAPALVRVGENARRLLVADTAGTVYLFDADQAGEQPRQRWRGTADGPIPAGKPTVGFVVSPGPGGVPLVSYAVDGKHLVCVSAGGGEKPVWVARRPGQDDLLGWVADGNRLVVTDQGGAVTVYDAGKGEKLGPPARPDGDLLPRTPAVPFGPGRLLLPLWDGSAVFLPYAGM